MLRDTFMYFATSSTQSKTDSLVWVAPNERREAYGVLRSGYSISTPVFYTGATNDQGYIYQPSLAPQDIKKNYEVKFIFSGNYEDVIKSKQDAKNLFKQINERYKHLGVRAASVSRGSIAITFVGNTDNLEELRTAIFLNGNKIDNLQGFPDLVKIGEGPEVERIKRRGSEISELSTEHYSASESSDSTQEIAIESSYENSSYSSFYENISRLDKTELEHVTLGEKMNAPSTNSMMNTSPRATMRSARSHPTKPPQRIFQDSGIPKAKYTPGSNPCPLCNGKDGHMSHEDMQIYEFGKTVVESMLKSPENKMKAYQLLQDEASKHQDLLERIEKTRILLDLKRSLEADTESVEREIEIEEDEYMRATKEAMIHLKSGIDRKIQNLTQ